MFSLITLEADQRGVFDIELCRKQVGDCLGKQMAKHVLL